MASAASSSRKRKISSSDLDAVSSHRKKSRDSDKDATKGSGQSKTSKPKSKKDIKAGLKTVSELAKLVTSGAVQVPKSLVHYASDKAVLLDQVFTILSPNDVNGMLPDILKGLKIKRVKSLCYEQLKGMSLEEITAALQRDRDESITADVSTSMVTSSMSNQTLQPSVHKTEDSKIETTYEESARQTAQVACSGHHECRSEPTSTPCKEECSNQGTVQSKEETVLHVSDISHEDKGKRDSKQDKTRRKRDREHGKRREESREPAILKEEYIVSSQRLKRQGPDKVCNSLEEPPNPKTKKEIVNEDVFMRDNDIVGKDDGIIYNDVMVEVDNVHVVSEEAGCSVFESSDEGSDLDVEVSELDAAKLLEMEMRRRALESELKKFTRNNEEVASFSNQTSLDNDRLSSKDESITNYVELDASESKTFDSQSLGEMRKQKIVSDSLDQEGSESKVEADTMDVGQLLEMKLRQKALQSLLNKKKQNSMQ